MQNKQGHAWLRKVKDALKLIKFNDDNALQEINIGVKKFKLITDKHELWGEHEWNTSRTIKEGLDAKESTLKNLEEHTRIGGILKGILNAKHATLVT